MGSFRPRDKFWVIAVSNTPASSYLIDSLIRGRAGVSYHAWRWYVHVASVFPLSHHYQAVLAWGS
jgi:hypothetical protein